MGDSNTPVSCYARTQSNVTASHSIEIAGRPEDIFAYVERIGGENGWYSYDRLLALRRIKPLQRGGKTLHVGDKADFFTVAVVEPNRELQLKAGRTAGLDDLTATFRLEPIAPLRTRLSVITTFAYLNTLGKVYWAAIKPFDRLLQRKMLRTIKQLVETHKE
jgi:hypothetical protein